MNKCTPTRNTTKDGTLPPQPSSPLWHPVYDYNDVWRVEDVQHALV